MSFPGQNPRTRGVSERAEQLYRREEDYLNQPLRERQDRMAGLPPGIDPYSAETSINAQKNRFKVLTTPGTRQIYEEKARELKMSFGPQTELSPLILTESTEISTEVTDNNPQGIAVSLNADTPTQRLRYYFQDGAFIRRVTSTVIATVLTAAGQPSAGFFQNTDPRDYIFAQFRRDGSGQLFQTRRMPLSAMSGDGAHSYFFNLIPAVQPGGSILLELSLIPPLDEFAQQDPPWVTSIGEVIVDLHTERFNAFGV